MTEQENPSASRMKEVASEIKEDVKAQAAEAADASGKKLRSALERQKERAAGELDSLARAFRGAASSFQEGEEARSAYYVGKAAQAAEGLSKKLREKDARTLVDEAADYARRHPLAVAAGGLLAGALLGRFLGMGHKRDSGGRSDAA
jgi:hypothetical protein